MDRKQAHIKLECGFETNVLYTPETEQLPPEGTPMPCPLPDHMHVASPLASVVHPPGENPYGDNITYYDPLQWLTDRLTAYLGMPGTKPPERAGLAANRMDDGLYWVMAPGAPARRAWRWASLSLYVDRKEDAGFTVVTVTMNGDRRKAAVASYDSLYPPLDVLKPLAEYVYRLPGVK